MRASYPCSNTSN